MPWIKPHPHKHLIRHLWPDKHLYAATLLFLAAGIGAAFAVVAYVVPVTLARDMPTHVAGWNWPFGIVIPAIVLVLGYAAYATRRPWMGFLAAAFAFVSFGALGVSSILAVGSAVFLFLARREGEHANPATKDLHPHAWPDKSLAAALLFAVAAIGSIVWGAMLLTGWLEVRTLDVTLWGALSVLVGLIALYAAALCYWQRSFWACMAAAALVVIGFSFVSVGPALGIGVALLLARARGEGEFGA